ncbi:hypothetical protein AFLA_000871 [Aspergillus flavus NRRL3357]|nr:hypothetical protein AFLA_000871 [Aspergillus flavus NRRL3357]
MWGNFKRSLIACSSPFASFDKDLIRHWKILLPVQTLKRFQSMVTLSSLALRPRQSQAAVYDLNHRH